MKMFMFMYARVMYPTLKKEVGVEIIISLYVATIYRNADASSHLLQKSESTRWANI